MNAAEVKASIERARTRLVDAEKEMQLALSAVAGASPSEKTIIGGALAVAFAQVNAARLELASAEKVLAAE